MKLSSSSFKHGSAIPGEFAFAVPDPKTHVRLSANRNPELRWEDVPPACRSLVLLCVDPDVPTVGDDVNQEGRVVRSGLPRGDFCHWVLVDVPPSCDGIGAGDCSDGITPRGKQDPPGPRGSRQGLNDYTGWFAGDPDMEGRYFGYDGPCPPWNDERVHNYRFELFATDLARCPVDGAFTAADVRAAIEGHVLARATWTGTYTLNPTMLRP